MPLMEGRHHMLCEETCGFSMEPKRNGSPLDRDASGAQDHWTQPSKRTLYASLWHCPACERNVRVYSLLSEVIAGSIRKDCPTCEKPMAAGSGPEPHPQTPFSMHTTAGRLNPSSAWAA